MAQIAIKGHPTRGKEVIEILKMLGGVNVHNLYGDENYAYYTIDSNKEIKGGIYIFDNEDLSSYTLEEFLEKFPYKVGDKVLYHDSKVYIKSMKWGIREIIYTVEWEKELWETTVFYLQPYKEETVEENLTIQDIRDNNAEWLLNKLEKMSVKKVLQTISDLYDKLHKPQYPKTYEECCKVLGIDPDNYLSIRNLYRDDGDEETTDYESDLLEKFDHLRELTICRDAYWKIAGEQMKLGKPWEPEWETSEVNFTIVECTNLVVKSADMCNKRILAFPTKEMQNAFYENFKDLIEQCKKLL